MRSQHQRAFTLIELMVSVAILIGIMAMVGVVFNTAGRSSSRAQANSTAYRELRQAIGHIRSDLGSVQLGTDFGGAPQGILGIAGVEVQAYATPQDVNAGTLTTHRADVLLLFTSRAIEPYAFQNKPVGDPLHIDEFAQNSVVVYGHADLGTLTLNGTIWTFPAGTIRSVEDSPPTISASQWHLARRVIGFPKDVSNPAKRTQDGIGPWTGATSLNWFDDAEFLEGKSDVVWMVPAFLTSAARVGSYSYPSTGGNADYGFIKSGEWYRRESGAWHLFKDNFWFKLAGSGTCSSPDVAWTRTPTPTPPEVCALDPGSFVLPDLRPVFYSPGLTRRRTVIDPNPPMEASARLGSQFLPSCSDFKVEFTYDDPRGIQLSESGGTWTAQPQAAIRWQSVTSGEQIVWTGLSVDPNNYASGTDVRANTDPIRWPRALRITVRTYGPTGGLDRPIEETIIWTFGYQ